MALLVILILVGVVIALMVYNMSIHNKVKTFTGINQKINSLNVLQDFMNAVGEETSVEDKIKRVNEILLERFNIKYSSIIAFDGAEYAIKATNVDEKHFETLKNMHTEDVFKNSIANATPKYITIDSDDEKLSYQKSEFGRAKSAMFFPLYIDSVYIGYWLIESGEKHAFDDLDTAILDVVKDNIVAILKTVNYQSTMENINRTDLFTNLQSAEYLYGKGKKIIDRHVISTVMMFKITNLPEINDVYGRKTGNKIVTEVSRAIIPSLSKNYVFVRYMGPKFVIVFTGVEQDSVIPFVKDVKKYVENIKVPKVEVATTKKKTKKKTPEEVATPKINCVLSTYYKGTALDGITKKLEEYLDNADPNENKINYI
ncbi:MAG: diguanylate cyclase [Clostridia bacterium]|nr:diguanylate cyclase [Clostridia bacterium]